MGDRVLAVNTTDIRVVTHQEAVMALLQHCQVMKLTVQHEPLPAGFKEIAVVKEPGEKLGMIIKGGLRGQPGNPLDPADEGVFCVKVNPGSRASRDSGIKVGQRIIEVNGQSLLGATHQEAVAILRNAGDQIKLLVCDGFNPAAVSAVVEPPPALHSTAEPEAEPEHLNSTASSMEEEANLTVITNTSLPDVPTVRCFVPILLLRPSTTPSLPLLSFLLSSLLCPHPLYFSLFPPSSLLRLNSILLHLCSPSTNVSPLSSLPLHSPLQELPSIPSEPLEVAAPSPPVSGSCTWLDPFLRALFCPLRNKLPRRDLFAHFVPLLTIRTSRQTVTPLQGIALCHLFPP